MFFNSLIIKKFTWELVIITEKFNIEKFQRSWSANVCTRPLRRNITD